MKKKQLLPLVLTLGLLTALSSSVYSFDFGKIIQDELGKAVNNTVQDAVKNLQAQLRIDFPVVNQPKTSSQPHVYGNDVTVFGYDGCLYCRKAYNFLNSNGIPYKLMDVQKDAAAKAEFQRQGFRGVPQIIIKKEKLSGFSESQLRATLKRNNLMK